MRRNLRILILASFGFAAAGFARAPHGANLGKAPARLKAGATNAGSQSAGQNAEQDVMAKLEPHEGDYVVHDFKFADGEAMQDLRLHYTTLGEPKRDANGRVTNAVLILHGTGGTGHQFLRPVFAGELFEPG